MQEINSKEYESGYQQCIEDIKKEFQLITNNMDGTDFAYMATHNINPSLISTQKWDPKLIAKALIYRH